MLTVGASSISMKVHWIVLCSSDFFEMAEAEIREFERPLVRRRWSTSEDEDVCGLDILMPALQCQRKSST